MSRLYQFILYQWILGKEEDYVNAALAKGYITADERDAIVATPQVKI